MLAKLAQLRARLGSAAPEIHVVFVTLDPDRDTPARLRDYVRGFDATFVGLTGTPRALAGTRDAYGVVVARRQPPGASTYLLDHSAFAFVVDRAGQLRLMLPAGMSVEDMAQGLATLLY
jgi:protein SCO1/2